MDSINFFKGYNKVDQLQEEAFSRKSRKRLLIISVSAVVLLTVIIGAVVGIVVYKSNSDHDDEVPTSSSLRTPTDSIKAVCSVTQYPKSCFSSISSLESPKKTDPEDLFKLSLQVTVNELSKLSSLPGKIIAKANDAGEKAALRDCQDLIEDAIDRVNTSISSMEVGQGEQLLSASKINNIKTWLSSAITDQETCLDGLEEMKCMWLEEMKSAMKNSTEFTRNSLAIIAKIFGILKDFHIPIHRKLMGVDF